MSGQRSTSASAATSRNPTNLDLPTQSPEYHAIGADEDSDNEPWASTEAVAGGPAARLASLEDQVMAVACKGWNVAQDRQNLRITRDDLAMQLAETKVQRQYLCDQTNEISKDNKKKEDRVKEASSRMHAQEAEMQQVRADLAASNDEVKRLNAQLVTAHTKENVLNKQAAILQSQLYTSQSMVEDLREQLEAAATAKAATAEQLWVATQDAEEAHAVASAVQAESESREQLLHDQAAELHSQLYSLRSECEDLQQHLEQTSLAYETLKESFRFKEEACTELEQERARATDGRAELEQECARLKGELQSAVEASERDAASTRAKVHELQELHRTTSLENESITAAAAAASAASAVALAERDATLQNQFAAARSLTEQLEAHQDERAASDAEAAQSRARMAALESLADKYVARKLSENVVMRSLAKLADNLDTSFGNFAPVPEYIFVASLEQGEESADGSDEEERGLRQLSRWPAQCQVDLLSETLRLVPLTVSTQGTRTVPLHSIRRILRPESCNDAVDIEWLTDETIGTASVLRWRLMTGDEDGAADLMGALNSDRMRPGTAITAA